MNKFYGKIGYAMMNRDEDIYKEEIVERDYYGDVLKNNSNMQSSGDVNDNINISNEISIVADPFAYSNYFNIRYLIYNGVKWKVSSVRVDYPRLFLSLGGMYNAQQD